MTHYASGLAELTALAGTGLGHTDWLEVTQSRGRYLRRGHRGQLVDPC